MSICVIKVPNIKFFYLNAGMLLKMEILCKYPKLYAYFIIKKKSILKKIIFKLKSYSNFKEECMWVFISKYKYNNKIRKSKTFKICSNWYKLYQLLYLMKVKIFMISVVIVCS